MEKKINIAELLKDCPQGMELDSPVWNNIVFEEIDEDNIVIFRKSVDSKVYLTQYGEVNSIDGNCVIYPKGKTTWEGFQRPFDDGEIVATKNGLFIGIVRVKNNMQVNAYCSINHSGRFEINSTYGFERIATEEEKQKLFDAIKAILFADEYFVSVANNENPYGIKCDGPIIYKYFTNTDRNVFYIFVKDYITKFNN